MQVNINTVCTGDGYWSSRPLSRIKIKEIELSVLVDDDDEEFDLFGELRAYFDKADWNPTTDGLIYTDSGWLRSFRFGLRQLGLSWDACHDVEYSEQGMQGAVYVSMDVGNTFIQEFRKIETPPVDDHSQTVHNV